MKLNQLAAFREVMLTRSVSAAARNLFRTQPAISALISSLEQELGCELFARRGGRLHPVPEAFYLFEEANTILNSLTSVERNIKSLRDLESGILNIVSMPGPSVFLLPKLISRFVEGRDDVKVTLVTRSSPQVQQLLSTQRYDVGIADQGVTPTGESPLVDHDVIRCDCMCAMRADDPLAGQDEISAADLDGRPMAALHTEHSTHRHTRAAFEAMGADYNVRFETQYFIPLLTFIETGQAYSVVDTLSAESYRIYRSDDQRIVFRPFKPAVPLFLSLMTPAHRPVSRLAQSFNLALRDEIIRINSSANSEPSNTVRT
ncbi:LysR substrate-binding domain-containing protein [Hoeflea sp. TYP-13]|uniref:LysR substrate-binding domain-containing protein n=1 Tax=Hoeflea sp. TYP-13 TaxID=3230023 RepID=UPI0034C6A90D